MCHLSFESLIHHVSECVGSLIVYHPITHCPESWIFMLLSNFLSRFCIIKTVFFIPYKYWTFSTSGTLPRGVWFHEFWFVYFLTSLSVWVFIKMHNMTCAPCPKIFNLVYNDFIINRLLLIFFKTGNIFTCSCKNIRKMC